MRFLIRGGLGDEIAATGFVRELRRRMPDELVRIIRPRHPAVWENNPHLNRGNRDNGRRVYLRMQANEERGNIAFSFGLQSGIEIGDTTPELHLAPEELEDGAAKLDGLPRPRVAIDTGANWSSRRWMPDRWRDLSDRLRAAGVSVVEIGVPGQDHYGFERHTKIPASIELLNLSVRESAAVIAASDLYVGNDSGCFHMAAAVGTPHLILFGVKRRGCLAYPKTMWIEDDRPCAPSCSEMCRRKAGPGRVDFCMSKISVCAVEGRVMDFLGKGVE